jgi:hypothetical protein
MEHAPDSVIGQAAANVADELALITRRYERGSATFQR